MAGPLAVTAPVDEAVVYKFAELSIVTSETLEECVNAHVVLGWRLDGIRFVVTEASRRPAMAFVSFVRPAPSASSTAAAGSPASPAAVAPAATVAPAVSGKASRSPTTRRRPR